MRLLLDEMYSPQIARQLRRRGHDAVSVHERDLAGASDEDLFALAVFERRAVVTNDVPDFARLVDQAAAAGRDHFGVVFTSDRPFPRRPETIGLFVRALDALLAERPGDRALMNRVRWLS